MEDLFYNRNLSPMNMFTADPFDSEEHIFELKHDGARCLAYIDNAAAVIAQNLPLGNSANSVYRHEKFPNLSTDFISRNQNSFSAQFPELFQIADSVSGRAILDGELIVLSDGRASFSEFIKRMHKKDKRKIARAAAENPAQFVAFDILYLNGQNLTALPLLQRKAILAKQATEGGSLVLSRYIETQGKAFFALAQSQNLEGIIAKKKQSAYHLGKRTKDWQKIKSKTYNR